MPGGMNYTSLMNPIKSIRIVFLLLIAAGTILSGCSKSKTKSWLLGRWSRINVVDMTNISLPEIWEFQSDGTFRLLDAISDSGDTLDEQGNYVMKSYSKFEISLSDTTKFDYLVGVWQIVKHKNDYLMIVYNHDGHGLTFREFKKN